MTTTAYRVFFFERGKINVQYTSAGILSLFPLRAGRHTCISHAVGAIGKSTGSNSLLITGGFKFIYLYAACHTMQTSSPQDSDHLWLCFFSSWLLSRPTACVVIVVLCVYTKNCRTEYRVKKICFENVIRQIVR